MPSTSLIELLNKAKWTTVLKILWSHQLSAIPQPKGVICITGSTGTDPLSLQAHLITTTDDSYGSIWVHWQVKGANYILLTNGTKSSGRQKMAAQVKSHSYVSEVLIMAL